MAEMESWLKISSGKQTYKIIFTKFYSIIIIIIIIIITNNPMTEAKCSLTSLYCFKETILRKTIYKCLLYCASQYCQNSAFQSPGYRDDVIFTQFIFIASCFLPVIFNFLVLGELVGSNEICLKQFVEFSESVYQFYN